MPVMALPSHRATPAPKAVIALKFSSHLEHLRPNLRSQDVTFIADRNRRMVTDLTAAHPRRAEKITKITNVAIVITRGALIIAAAPPMVHAGGLHVLNERVRILIVEDDPDMAELISDLMEAEGWLPMRASSAEEAAGILVRETVHLVLVDHNLPGTSGRTFAQRLRAQMNIGIIMVTAAGSAADRVLGLETAADDYVVKPFEPIELTARIKAVLRRTFPSLKPEREIEREHEPASLALSDWSVDLKGRRAICASDPTKSLTSAEFALLEILAETPNTPVSRAHILERLGSESDRYIDRNVDVLVLRLRRKIERNPDLPRHIKTRRGKGYVLELDNGEPQP
jgi:two-component system phosphate regulon response regulator OmpR